MAETSFSPSQPSRFTALAARHWEALLFIFTVIVPLLAKYRRRPVVFNRFTGLGDIICTIPAAREIRKRHPGAPFIYNCHKDFTAIPRIAEVAEQVTSFKDVGLVGYWYRFLLGGYYHFAHGDDASDNVARETMVVEFCRQFDVPVADQHPELVASLEAVEKAKTLLRERGLDPAELVLIHPGPSWPVKEWPRESWTRLVAELRDRGCTNIAQLGVGRYMNFGEVSVQAIPGAVSLIDALSVEECLATISLARLFVGIDSGLLHMAACARTPSVGLFGSTFPQFFYPPEFRADFVVSDVNCAGCYHRLPRLHWITGCPYDIKCMKTLPVAETLQACLAKLRDVPEPSS